MYKILFFLGILIFILLVSSKEGFETPPATSISDTSNSANYSSSSSVSIPSFGKYDYLAPIQPTNTWNPDITTKFVNRYNTNLGTGNDDKMMKVDDQNQKNLVAWALEEEIVYYVNNGKFPICLHVKDFFDANPDTIAPIQMGSITVNTKTISHFLPNRLLYGVYVAPKESQLKPPPEAYDIYMGKKPKPEVKSSSSSTSLVPSKV